MCSVSYTSLCCYSDMRMRPYNGVGVQLQFVRCDALVVLLKQIFKETLETRHREEHTEKMMSCQGHTHTHKHTCKNEIYKLHKSQI